MKKIGYVLSGGGARGFAHLGVIKLLEEIGFRPFALAGTSVGAVAGALYAAGKKPEEILELMKKRYLAWRNISWKAGGFFSMDVLKKILEDAIGENNFKVLKVKLFVAATDLIAGQPVIFSKGRLFEAIIASASIPVIFEPVSMGNKLLVDGGVMNNFPVEPLIKICDVIIGSDVNNTGQGMGNQSRPLKTFNVLDRCFHLAIANTLYHKVRKCDVFIQTPLDNYDMYDIKNADTIFETGYHTALLHKEKLKSLIVEDVGRYDHATRWHENGDF